MNSLSTATNYVNVNFDFQLSKQATKRYRKQRIIHRTKNNSHRRYTTMAGALSPRSGGVVS
jgi:hypothetical protein